MTHLTFTTLLNPFSRLGCDDGIRVTLSQGHGLGHVDGFGEILKVAGDCFE